MEPPTSQTKGNRAQYTVANAKQDILEEQQKDIMEQLYGGGNVSAIQQWKRKYLYPFGDIAPIQKHGELKRPLVDITKVKSVEKMIEELEIQEGVSSKPVEKSYFEELMTNKYRLTIEDLGGHKN